MTSTRGWISGRCEIEISRRAKNKIPALIPQRKLEKRFYQARHSFLKVERYQTSFHLNISKVVDSRPLFVQAHFYCREFYPRDRLLIKL